MSPSTAWTGDHGHIDALFTQVVDWDVIERHWYDMMQVVLSIQAGTVLPSMLLQKLGVYSRHSSLYKAFSELGVERTLFLLEYMSDATPWQQIRGDDQGRILSSVYRLDCVWGWCSAPGTRRARETHQVSGFSRECDHVAQCGGYDQCAGGMQQEGVCVTPEATSRLSPYLNGHLKRFGQYVLDMRYNRTFRTKTPLWTAHETR